MNFEDLAEKFSNSTVLVVGDHYLDRNCVGSYNGYSREKESLPIFKVESETFNPGGAGDLGAEVATLGAHTIVAGVWGVLTDPHRRALETRFRDLGIDSSGMVAGARTPTFEKYYFQNTAHVIRVDLDSEGILEPSRENLVRKIEKLLPRCDLVVVADYDEGGKGVCDRDVLAAVAQFEGHKFGTSRGRIGSFTGFDTLVVNEKELMEAAGDSQTTLDIKAALVLSVTGASNLVVTLGERGAVVYQRKEKVIDLKADAPLNVTTVPSMPLDGKIDTCGCGDVFLAMLSLCLHSGASFEDSTKAANAAARAESRKLFGAHPVALEKIEAEYEGMWGD